MYAIKLKDNEGQNVLAVVAAVSVSDAENQMLEEYNGECRVTSVKEVRFASIEEGDGDELSWYIVDVSVVDEETEKTYVDKFLISASSTMQAQESAKKIADSYVSDTEIKAVKKTNINFVKLNNKTK